MLEQQTMSDELCGYDHIEVMYDEPDGGSKFMRADAKGRFKGPHGAVIGREFHALVTDLMASGKPYRVFADSIRCNMRTGECVRLTPDPWSDGEDWDEWKLSAEESKGYAATFKRILENAGK